MFIEPSLQRNEKEGRYGWIEVICGAMFSGKTEELIRRLKRAMIAKQKVEIFKPHIDNRYHDEKIVSHSKQDIRSTSINVAQDILLYTGDCDVVGIDEAQFLDTAIIDVCNNLANNGKRVIVAGLDMDYEGKPFGAMPQLMAIAEFVTKVHAICAKTGQLASYSFRIHPSDSRFMLGEIDKYEARCRKSFFEGMRNRKKEN